MALTFGKGLTEYVEQQRLPLIQKLNLGAKSLDRFTLQTGVRGKTALNILNTTVKFGDGTACGWNEAGTTALSQREIDAVPLSINMEFCDKAMLKYWTRSQVAVGANRKGALPFEEQFVADIINGENDALETMIWTGTKSTTSCAGIATIAAADEGVKNKVTDTDAVKLIDKVYAAIPATILPKAKIFVGDDVLRTYVQALVAKNLYNYPTTIGEDMVVLYPGSTVEIVGTPGLNGSDKVVATVEENLFVGVDMEGDMEDLKIWYSDDNQAYRLAANFVIGVQYAFSDQIVLGTLGA